MGLFRSMLVSLLVPLDNVNEKLNEQAKRFYELKAAMERTAKALADAKAKGETELKALELIPYDKSPSSIQSQMEARAGLVAAPSSERAVLLAAKNGEKKAK